MAKKDTSKMSKKREETIRLVIRQLQATAEEVLVSRGIKNVRHGEKSSEFTLFGNAYTLEFYKLLRARERGRKPQRYFSFLVCLAKSIVSDMIDELIQGISPRKKPFAPVLKTTGRQSKKIQGPEG